MAADKPALFSRIARMTEPIGNGIAGVGKLARRLVGSPGNDDRSRAASAQNPARRSGRIIFEALEPRLLLSADSTLTAALPVEPPVNEPIAPPAIVSNITAEAPPLRISERPIEQSSQAISNASDAAATRHEVAFVDTAVSDYQQIVDDVLEQRSGSREIELHLLDSTRDGVEQISEVLANHDSLDAVHFISHAVQGSVRLGATWLDGA